MRFLTSLGLAVLLLATGCASDQSPSEGADPGELARLRAENARLGAAVARLDRDLADLRALVAMNESPAPPPRELDAPISRQLEGPPVPPIDAVVLEVGRTREPAGVRLSVGWADGVEKGYQFSVYRGSTFVGKVVVERVRAGSCDARVLFTREGESVQRGDAAATRLQ